MSEKKPRLVYYEEGETCWCTAPNLVEDIIDINALADGEIQEVSFKRVDMTDDEWESLPDL